MLAQTRVCIFIGRCAVKHSKTVGVAREVRRYPVHNNAYTVFMALINKILKFVAITVARGCREVAGNLITPRAVKRILCNRHHFNMCVTHILYIGYKLVSKLLISIIAAVLVHFPRADVHFVDINRL